MRRIVALLLSVTLAVAGLLVSPSPALAAPSCAVTAFNPRQNAQHQVYGTVNFTCYGPVRGVSIEAKLLYRWAGTWYVADRDTASWGNVPSYRSGVLNPYHRLLDGCPFYMSYGNVYYYKPGSNVRFAAVDYSAVTDVC